jgi:hypothetical protein
VLGALLASRSGLPGGPAERTDLAWAPRHETHLWRAWQTGQFTGSLLRRGTQPHARLPGPAQRWPTSGDALNAKYRYLELRCLGCDTNQTDALDIVRPPKATPVHELERYMRCKDCSQVRG